jgi:hypothetical protein
VRKRTNSTSGGGVPPSLASWKTSLPLGSRDPVLQIPDSLEEAKRLFSQLPPLPPGRSLAMSEPAKKV